MQRISFGILALVATLAGCASSSPDSNSSATAESNGTDPTLQPVAPPGAVMSIPVAVAALESAEILPGPGHDDAVAASGSTPLEAIQAYVDYEYDYDPEDGTDFKFVDHAAGFDIDEQVAGTFTLDVAIKEVLAAIDGNDQVHDQDVTANRADEVIGLMKSIDAAGGTFGFDGFGQNGCAAPTAMLLVVDPTDKTVYAVDLNPCSED